MAAGKINLQKESGGIVKISPVDGIGVTEVTVPESGNLVSVDTSVTDNAIARFDGTTGAIQNSSVVVDDSGNINGVSSLSIDGGAISIKKYTATPYSETPLVVGTQHIHGNWGMAGIYHVSYDNLLYGRLAGLSFKTSEQDAPPTERMRITPSGNVGIGTNSPTTKMHIVDGDLRIESSSASPTIQLTDTGVANSYIYMPNGSNALAYNVGGAERMRINSSGIVTMPYQPSFYAYPSANSTMVQNVWTKPAIDLTGWNTGNHYDTTDSRFTAPVAGKYNFSWMIQLEGETCTWFYFYPCINGGTGADRSKGIIFSDSRNQATYHTESGSWVLNLQAGDYIEWKYMIVGTSPVFKNESSFWGYLIG